MVDIQPDILIFSFRASAQTRMQNVQMLLSELFKVVLPYAVLQCERYPHRIPLRRGARQPVLKRVFRVANCSQSILGPVQNICEDSAIHAQENFKISRTEDFLVVEELGQLNEPNPQNFFINAYVEHSQNVDENLLEHYLVVSRVLLFAIVFGLISLLQTLLLGDDESRVDDQG